MKTDCLSVEILGNIPAMPPPQPHKDGHSLGMLPQIEFLGPSLASDPRLVRDRLDLVGPSRSDGLRGDLVFTSEPP